MKLFLYEKKACKNNLNLVSVKLKNRNAFFYKIRLFLPKMLRTFTIESQFFFFAKLRTSEPQIDFTGS